MDNQLLDVLTEWMERYGSERNPAPSTVRSIRSFVGRFLEFCQDLGRPNLNMITREDVIRWLNSLIGVRTSSRRSAERFLVLFFNRAVVYGMRAAPMPTIGYRGPADIPRASLKGFTMGERKTMMVNAKKLGPREKAIFYLLSQRPMRQKELLVMKVGDIDLEQRTITIFKSKNRSTRTVTIPDEAYDAIREIIRGKTKDDLVFGLASRTMNHLINDMIETLGVKRNGRSSHAFRHTVIMSLLRQGKIDVSTVARIAGNSPKTIYEHYNQDVSHDEQVKAQDLMDKIARGTVRDSAA